MSYNDYDDYDEDYDDGYDDGYDDLDSSAARVGGSAKTGVKAAATKGKQPPAANKAAKAAPGKVQAAKTTAAAKKPASTTSSAKSSKPTTPTKATAASSISVASASSKSAVGTADNDAGAEPLAAQPTPAAAPAVDSAAEDKWFRQRRAIIDSELQAPDAGSTKKQSINLVVIGHVDSGKSTLVGHLLVLTGRISDRVLHKLTRDSSDAGKGSFRYAWVLDEQATERQRGITIDVATQYFDTDHRAVTVLDAPGHKDYVPAMISGASQADSALLVIPASAGEYEVAFSVDGQTREHAILARALGVTHVIVVINKMDSVDWSEERYNTILTEVTQFLRSAGYKDDCIHSVPISAINGDNLQKQSAHDNSQWYKGGTLLQLIDKLPAPTDRLAAIDKPMRANISDTFKSQSMGFTIAGNISCGSVAPNDTVLVQPLNQQVQIKAVEVRGKRVNVAVAGDNADISIRDAAIDTSTLQPGQWLSSIYHPIPIVTSLEAQILTLHYKVPIIAGASVVIFTGNSNQPAVISQLLSVTPIQAGGEAKTSVRPRVLTRSSNAVVQIDVPRGICLELFSEYRELGRFSLRRGDETIAVGVVTRIIRQQ